MGGGAGYVHPPPSRPINYAWASHYAEIYQRNHRRSHPFWICKKQHSHFKDTSASLVCRLISFLSRFSSCLIVFAAFSRLKLTLHNAGRSQINSIIFVSLRCVFFVFIFQELYMFCYKTVLAYLDSFSTYSNFAEC